MLVCWEWLSQYVNLTTDPNTLAHRFAMSGLNHESTTTIGSDTVIDLEVTSNRGDCLGHIGVAREASVLLNSPLCIPNPQPKCSGPCASELLQVENRFADGCFALHGSNHSWRQDRTQSCLARASTRGHRYQLCE